MFSTNFKNIWCIFAENRIFEKSKMTGKMTDMLWNDCCHSNSSCEKWLTKDRLGRL